MFNALYLNSESIPSVDIRRMPLNPLCLYRFADQSIPKHLSGKQIESCNAQSNDLRTSELPRDADVIALSSRWDLGELDGIPEFIEQIRSISPADIVIFGRTAEFDSVPGFIIRNGLSDKTEELLASTRNDGLDALNFRLARLAQRFNVTYIDKVPIICSEDRSRCDVLDENGNLLYFDYGHWTLEGAKHFGRKMIDSGHLQDVLGLDDATAQRRHRQYRPGLSEETWSFN
jgi:hypothetical protein